MDVMRMLVIVAAVLAIGGVAVAAAATHQGGAGAAGTQISSLTLNEKMPMAGMNRKVTLRRGATFRQLAHMIPLPLPAPRKSGGILCGVCPLDVLTITLSTGAIRSYERMTAPHAVSVVITRMRKLLPPPADNQPAAP
jgi:hypothetical protein